MLTPQPIPPTPAQTHACECGGIIAMSKDQVWECCECSECEREFDSEEDTLQ